ncbi:MAG: urate hydroxylase PuuD [Alphaproteobacteria bacterium]|nr:urate hydroxylase PuuD [Alphaproteobacteria bacterium]
MWQAHLMEWVNLALRWTHIIAGIAWIGSSFFFMWLDSHLERGATPKPDIEGELWLVHSGGFYQIEKYRVAPPQMPATLHWFKWEAAATWISGIALLIVAFYLTGGAFLVDAGSPFSAPVSTAIGIATLIAGWFIYDAIYRSALGRRGILAAALSFVLLVVAAYLMSEIFIGRAAYVHVGALMGTIMAANVWSVVIPAQQKLVDATLAGEERDASLGAAAKQRSVHNNYMTLPVVFIMVSSHYPSTYGHQMNWLVLIGMVLVGAVVRHYFNLRNGGARPSSGYWGWTWGAAAVGMVALMVYTAPAVLSRGSAEREAAVSFTEVEAIIAARCVACHSATPTDEIFVSAPGGVMFDTDVQIQAMAVAIRAQAVASDIMPLGNKTGMTEPERDILGRWIDAGAKIVEED